MDKLKTYPPFHISVFLLGLTPKGNTFVNRMAGIITAAGVDANPAPAAACL